MDRQTSDAPLHLRLALSEPDIGAANNVALRLSKSGMEIHSVTERGLLVSGPQGVIERTFRSPVETSGAVPQFMVEPDVSDLPGVDASRAYFPRQPEFFKG